MAVIICGFNNNYGPAECNSSLSLVYNYVTCALPRDQETHSLYRKWDFFAFYHTVILR